MLSELMVKYSTSSFLGNLIGDCAFEHILTTTALGLGDLETSLHG